MFFLSLVSPEELGSPSLTYLPFHLRPEDVGALCALEELALVAVLDGKVHLDVHLGIKDLLAQGTPRGTQCAVQACVQKAFVLILYTQTESNVKPKQNKCESNVKPKQNTHTLSYTQSFRKKSRIPF